MRERHTAYVILLLVALVLTLVPSALWVDTLVPLDDWNNWYWKGQPHPRPHFTLQNPPALFRAEMAVFKTLAVPPAYVHRLVHGVPTHYAVPWMSPYIQTAGTPPFASTLQHWAWALPFWLALNIVVYEVARWVRHRWRSAA